MPIPRLLGIGETLAERAGFAHIPQAAVWLASQTLRILYAKSAGTSLISAQKNAPHGACVLAERAGFEPAVGYEPTHAFQACDLNHSSISPGCLARSACTEQVAEYSKYGYTTPLT